MLRIVVIWICICRNYFALPDAYDVPADESLPKPVTYFTSSSADEQLNSSNRSQDVRFNHQLTSPNNVLDGLPMNFLSAGMYPFKIDLGGLLLGAVVGLGALVVIPKLVHVLSSELTGYGQSYHGSLFGRSEVTIPQGVSQMMGQVEDILQRNHVNSSVCMQKAICSYVNSIATKPANSNNRKTDASIETITSNSMINFLIDGSKFKVGIESGLQGTDCGILYPQCPFTKQSITSGIKQMIASNLNEIIKDKTYNIENNLYNNNDSNNLYNNGGETNMDF